MSTATENAAVCRPSSRQGSPVPRRQLGTLSVNQRSYSRMSSKGIFGDDSPLMSPMPYYPRHRSVTFAEERSEMREERPNYNPTYSPSAPVSPVRQRSPPPVSILKTNSSFADDDDNSGAAPTSQVAAATLSSTAQRRKDSLRNSPVPPTRGRSHSRQRLAARRREAQLHHSFYDDSFVEEFVLSAKTELEKEEAEQRRLQEQLRAEQEKARRAERHVSEATEKINALQHAKEVLMAATVRRHASVTPSPPRARADKPKRNSSLLRELEEDPDPAVQEALKELSRQSLAKQQKRKRQQGQQSQRRRSMPIVSEDALTEGGAEKQESEGEDDDTREARKRSRLEKIVSRVFSKKGKSKSKHSVVVIDWSDMDSDDGQRGDMGGAENQEEEEGEQEVRPIGNKHQRSRQTKSRSVVLAPEAALVPSTMTSCPASARRNASSHRRDASALPDLGDSFLFEEEEQPILLPRRQHHRPAATRSISHIDVEEDEADVLDTNEASVERIVRRPPRATRAPATRQRRGPVTGRSNASASYVSASVGRGRRAQAAAQETESATMPAPAPRQRRAAAPRADPNDPMAVFFEAAFPSPSKFDEMLMQAGGLPETQRGGAGGRGQGRQPNLVLPSSIGRRR